MKDLKFIEIAWLIVGLVALVAYIVRVKVATNAESTAYLAAVGLAAFMFTLRRKMNNINSRPRKPRK